MDNIILLAKYFGMKFFTIIIIIMMTNVSIFGNTAFFEEFKSELSQLERDLEERGVPSQWLRENLSRDNFSLYRRMESYFTNMSESRVSRGEMTVDDYKLHFGVDQRVRRGLGFIEEHQELLQQVEQVNGIHYELVVAILGMETNFAEQRQRGNFIVFDALVSQYVLLSNRRRFAANELSALYEYSKKINRDVDYFIGSFAGASGWGQFIPTSLRAFFISADGIDENTDIYSIEDTLFSIENYLAAHRLNRNTIDSAQRRRDAVFAYNRSNAYVDAVLYIYDKLKDRDIGGL